MAALELDFVKTFYVGGFLRATTSALFGDDRVVSNAMYVQHWKPAQLRCRVAVIFIHGGMHTGATWESTPDGREGWQALFARAGFEVLVIDQAWRGRSAPDSDSSSPERPVIAGMELATRFARGGPRFPSQCLHQYVAQLWPDYHVAAAIASGLPGLSDPRALPPLVELVDQFERVILVTHSQGADLGWKTAAARPERIAAIYSVEPAITCPGLDNPDLAHIPVRILWGDNVPEVARTLSSRDIAQARDVARSRTTVSIDVLPEAGIFGNGHMLMMEDNNAELTSRAITWLQSLTL